MFLDFLNLDLGPWLLNVEPWTLNPEPWNLNLGILQVIVLMRYNRDVFLFATMIAMPVALFVSRGMLSISMIAFLLVSFTHKNMGRQLRDFFSTPLLWSMSLLFLFPLISGLWSEDKDTWMNAVRIKLPLLLLPLGFAGKWTFNETWWNRIAYVLIAVTFIASAWTFYNYLGNLSAVHASYLEARTMVTPLANDHVRFSWILSISALLCGYFFLLNSKKDKLLSILFLVALTWFIVFLHILAARTGLLSLYIMIASVGLWMITRKLKMITGVLMILLLILLPVIAYQLMPSFRNRVNYVRYEMGYFSEANYLRGSNDAVRVISWKAGWATLWTNPLLGTGYGDIDTACHLWYEEHYPQMTGRDRIYPSNQWLMYGAGCGIAGFLLFTFSMLVPFFTRVRNRLLWWLVNATAGFAFLFDIALEVQFGVFIYAFLVLWLFSWLRNYEQ